MNMKKKTEIFKRVYKSECSVQDDIVSFRDYTVVHAYDIDMLATAKNKKIIGYFVRDNDEEMIRAFDNVGKLQMKLNVLSDVLKKNNETQHELYEQIKTLKEQIKLLEDKNEEYRQKIIECLDELKKEDEVRDYLSEEEKNRRYPDENINLVDDDIKDLLD